VRRVGDHGALSVTLGVVLGAVLTRRAQERHWLRDKQLVAYQEMLAEYARFVVILKRAHWSKAGWDYDWAVWSAALVSASLVAPSAVAVQIENFAVAIGGFLRVASVDARTEGLTEKQFDDAMRPTALAQLALVNAIRVSLGRGQGHISTSIGGALTFAE
jgi:hypothetical protein